MRPRLNALAVAVAVAAAVVVIASQQDARADFQKGVCYAHSWGLLGNSGYGSETSARSMERLRKLGVGWLSLTNFGFMDSVDSAEVRSTGQWGAGESDDRLAAEVRRAHATGLRVALKPHIWIRRGEWQGALAWKDDAAYRRWFGSYREFIRHNAQLAEREHFDLLVIGTELKTATFRDPASWRALVTELRGIYHGPMTYAANWDEAEHVAFWDALDFIGVQAYAPLTTRHAATVDDLRAGWRVIAADLARLSARVGRRIILTEIGYRPTVDAGMAPATWPESDPDRRYAPEVQVACYRAALESLWGQPWLAGIYVWNWFTDSKDESGPTDFSPAGKPAEAVLKEFYLRPATTTGK